MKMHLTPNTYKIITVVPNPQEIITLKCIWHHLCTKPITLKANVKVIVTEKCIWHQICTKMLLCMANGSGNRHLKMHVTPNMYKTCYFEGKCSGNHYCKLHLTPNMYKIHYWGMANAKKIITWKCMWHHIYAKLLLCRQMLRKLLLEHEYDSTYVTKLLVWKANAQEICRFKMHLSPNMYKMITLKANAKEIVTWKCFWCQNTSYFAGLSKCDICICKCSPWEFSDKCDQVLYYCSLLWSAAIVVHWR